MNQQRVVITGHGCYTPAGRGAAAALDAIAAGTPLDRFAAPLDVSADLPLDRVVRVAKTPMPAPDTIARLPRPYPDAFTQMAIVAVDDALEGGGLTNGNIDRTRLGLVLNSTLGPVDTVTRHLATLFRDGPAKISPMSFARSVFNAAIGELSRRHTLQGPSTLVVGASAIGYAFDLLQQGDADAVICVGVDEIRDLHACAYAHAGLLDAGLGLGDTTVALVLERLESATDRGADILAEVTEYAAVFCPQSVHHVTKVTPTAIGRSMRHALDAACIEPADVDLVVSLANGDRCLGVAERSALASVFGTPIRTLAPKHTFGETFGSAGVLGTLVAAAALARGAAEFRPATCLVNACEVGGAVWSTVVERWDES